MSGAYILVSFFLTAKLVKPASGRCLELPLNKGTHIATVCSARLRLSRVHVQKESHGLRCPC